MTTSLELSRIDELLRADHGYLSDGDECYFLREYTSHVGYAHSTTNDLILNFKKSVDRQGRPEWRHKQKAIEQVAREFTGALNPDWLAAATLVPMPPSRVVGDPLHDPRMVEMLTNISGAQDVRRLLVAKASRVPAHTTDDRPTVAELAANLAIDVALTAPFPSIIGLFDDVLVSGTSFVAGKQVLERQFPGVHVLGFFVARRVFGDG